MPSDLHPVLQTLQKIGVIPEVALGDTKRALPLAHALASGGLNCCEITFRTKQSADCMRLISRELPGFCLGAGTVLTSETAEAAVAAGARFIVSPGLNPVVVKRCTELGVPALPGCVTATEVQAAMQLGLRAVKFFPAKNHGGLAGIQALAAPFPDMLFVPTDGVDMENLAEYLRHKNVLAAGGGFMAPPALIEKGDFAAISKLAARAADISLSRQ
ncbi:MAG: bifunctional 4-hydroxy-2-oxoglutarate aldolase/2-dehydro-3-deoxy-phosphogluconate aldolase [Clostridia bacterium]|nr:bifunctional 4-hydroxy-2-oxoglutarate aldolase/2-dehydro-3-deoxy-phosphogluconate aldolase [Clostridia bacterium]